MIIRPEHFQFRIEAQHQQEQVLEELGMSDLRESLAPEESFQPFVTSSPCYCFVCNEKLTIPAIMWKGFAPQEGAGDELWLHPACTGQLVSGLKRDVDELNEERSNQA
jgi:hypothetical protein